MKIVQLLPQEVSYTEAREIVARRNDGTRLPTWSEGKELDYEVIPRGCWIEMGDSPQKEWYMSEPFRGESLLVSEWSGRIRKPILLVK